MDCVICLYNLFNTESHKLQITEDFSYGEEGAGIKTLRVLRKIFKEYMFDFHEINLNLSKEPFMITPCKHIFHSDCLENWFKQKKDCPSCRQDTGIEIN